MPEYSFICENCKNHFSIYCSISDYNSKARCLKCKSTKTHRDYNIDISSMVSSIKKSDSELKTIGDLANRNSDRMSADQKRDLYIKHNIYKEDAAPKELPKGMSRIKKPPKPKWR